ncbi:hypothetical protein PR048_030194 [Dryococelus australis]|uniref:Thyrotropin-releasing hormone receptor n=1 Tax=Dryococelus australis TaxID=614101 RepID=A0ABQ9G894_9NEOP|nr:hypothetical protein PR048_030194 [Dryococelus australis]
MLVIAEYMHVKYPGGSEVAICLTEAGTFWTQFFFIMVISVFFFVPLGVLLVLYAVIARHLMADPGSTPAKGTDSHNLRARRQVVLMLGTVVLCFFICLMPFRVLTLWIVVVPHQAVVDLGGVAYYNILFFSRVMHYLNSAVNPILYNLMSSKFRAGFMKLCGLRRREVSLWTRRRRWRYRNNTLTTSLSCTSSRRYTSQRVDQRVSPDLSWRSISVDSRASVKTSSPDRFSRISADSKVASLRHSSDCRPLARGNSPLYVDGRKLPTAVRIRYPVEALQNGSDSEASTSFRKNVIIRSSILNSHKRIEECSANTESYV